MTESNVIALNMSRERQAATMSGYMMLALLLLSIVAQIWGVYELANDNDGALQIATVIVAPIVLIFVACGFYMLQPNQAAAITLFGDYKGKRPDDGPPLGIALADAAKSLRPRQQFHQREDQGQRPARQPH